MAAVEKGKEAKGASEKIGYQPEYSGFQRFRINLRDLLDTLLFESVVIALVALYAIIIFIDLVKRMMSDDGSDDERVMITVTITRVITTAELHWSTSIPIETRVVDVNE